MNLTKIFDSVAQPLIACLKDGLCTQKAGTQILTLLIAELNAKPWLTAADSLQTYAKYEWIVEAFRANHIFPLAVPGSITTLPFKDMGFAVNMLTGEVDVRANGGALSIMKLTAAEFQHLIEQGQAALDLVVSKQALEVPGCSS